MSKRGNSHQLSKKNLATAKRIVRIALWTACAVAIAGIERLMPTPLPWIKLGLANGVALLVLMRMGFGAALVVNIARAVLIGFLLGTWATPVFLMSLGGAVVAVSAMALAKSTGRIGLIGISTLGAFTHMLVQFLLAAMLLVHHAGILIFTGPSLFAAIAAGIITGIITMILLERIPAKLL